MPARWAATSFSIFIASTMQTTWPASTLSPSATFTCEHRSLHRARTRLGRAAGGARGRALAPAAGELAIRRLRHEHLHLDAAAVDLRHRSTRSTTRRPTRAAARVGSVRQRLRARREQLATRRSRDRSRPRESTDARAAPCGSRSASSRRRSGTRRARAACARSRPRGRRRARSAWRSSGRRAARPPSPRSTPESTRTPGPDGSRYDRDRARATAGSRRRRSSALIRHSIAWPCSRISSCVNSSASPAAIWTCARTMSTPETSSVIVCSTWIRVFISMK